MSGQTRGARLFRPPGHGLDVGPYQVPTASGVRADTWQTRAGPCLFKKSKGASLETWDYSYDHRNQLTRAQKRNTDGSLEE